jgi:hypothetical protein
VINIILVLMYIFQKNAISNNLAGHDGHDYNPSIWEAEAGGSQVQGQLVL